MLICVNFAYRDPNKYLFTLDWGTNERSKKLFHPNPIWWENIILLGLFTEQWVKGYGEKWRWPSCHQKVPLCMNNNFFKAVKIEFPLQIIFHLLYALAPHKTTYSRDRVTRCGKKWVAITSGGGLMIFPKPCSSEGMLTNPFLWETADCHSYSTHLRQ